MTMIYLLLFAHRGHEASGNQDHTLPAVGEQEQVDHRHCPADGEDESYDDADNAPHSPIMGAFRPFD